MSNRTWIVGSSPECDLRVEAPTVSAQHCRLTECGDGYLLEDLGSSNGTLVGGQRIASPTIVRRDDMVTLGKTVALPWPPSSTSITIGRSSENDLVIDFDAVSSTHARLEREGSQHYLVDLGSTNGTAIHTPSNKISRAPLSRKDTVFFGTHRVSAAELIACLPRDIPRAATVLESSPLKPSIFEDNEPSADDSAGESISAVAEGFHSTKSWLIGIAVSVLCVCVIFGGKRLLSSGVNEQSNSSSPEKAVGESDSSANRSTTQSTTTRPSGTELIDLSSMPDEAAIRSAEPSLGVLGLRFGGSESYLTRVTTWSFAPSYALCPTKLLGDLHAAKEDSNEVDEAVSIFQRGRQVAILEHQVGKDSAEGFSLVRLEAPLEAICKIDSAKPMNVVPGQHLAMLGVRAAIEDNPDSIQCEFVRLTVDRIERDGDGTPMLLYCRPENAQDDVSGAPIFDAAGSVVGCAVSANREVVVMPITRLASLAEINP